jgi:hypothetical protein
MASTEEKDQCVFWFNEKKSPWVVLLQDGAPPQKGYLFVSSWMQHFQNDGLGGTVQRHGHHVHRTLPLWARMRDALAAVTEEMLEKTGREMEYRLDVLRETNVAYAEVY